MKSMIFHLTNGFSLSLAGAQDEAKEQRNGSQSLSLALQASPGPGGGGV